MWRVAAAEQWRVHAGLLFQGWRATLSGPGERPRAGWARNQLVAEKQTNWGSSEELVNVRNRGCIAQNRGYIARNRGCIAQNGPEWRL